MNLLYICEQRLKYNRKSYNIGDDLFFVMAEKRSLMQQQIPFSSYKHMP